ncbi:DMT family transporter [Protaetiibacter intestinalis]|uniref:DMT family transporter n=1 Tax=Protaetiibacter intestinalis TaxID=2419774 RepID=A0A387BBR9_9MICO|nr:DMT family transporter [Protaetiibacter intestinalis]AYF98586.1 DMT family transporter [Protaetiibacter intestinalis]
MPRIRLSPLVIAAISFTILAWASAFIVIRGVAPEIGGGALALGRLAIGTAALGVLALVTRGWLRPTRREWALLLLYGVAWFGAYNVTLNLAEHTLDAGTTAMIVGIGPILIALGAGVLLGEGVPRWLAIGAGVAFSGVVLIGLATSVFGAGGHVDVAGVLWALASAVTYATGVLAQKPLVRRLPAVQVTFLGCAIGLLACLPFAGQLVAEATHASAGALWGVVYLGVVPTALAFTTWGYALARVPAGQLGISTYLVPPIAILAGWAVFQEVPTVLAVVGGVLCLTGVALSRRRPAPRVSGTTPQVVPE